MEGWRDGGTERHLALFVPGRIRIGKDRSGQVRTGQDILGQVRTGQYRSGQVRTGQDK